MVRVGIVGKRGAAGVLGLRSVPGVEVAALYDRHGPTAEAQAREHAIPHLCGSYDELLERVDAVVVGSPMQLHAAHVVRALDAGRDVLSEVTAAVTLEECWRIKDAVARSGRVYALAENYCLFEENVMVREMCRKGLFGEPYFGEGEYVHEVRFLHRTPEGEPTWRYYWQVGQRGNTYATHEIGPLMQWFRAVRPGERAVSVSCHGSGVWTDPEHPHDDTSLTLLKLASGGLLKLRLDMMSNTPGMTFYSLQGTRGTYESGRGGGLPGRIWTGPNETSVWGDPPRPWRPAEEFREHLPPGWAEVHAEALKTGHGGADYHTARDFALALREGRPPLVGVDEALEWTAVGLVSQLSIEAGGAPVPVPDFRDPGARPVWLDLPAGEA